MNTSTSLFYVILFVCKLVTCDTTYPFDKTFEKTLEKPWDNNIPEINEYLSNLRTDLLTSKENQQKCYDGLGCVSLSPQWWHPKWRPVNELPSDRYAINTVFIHWFMQDCNLTSQVLGDLNLRGGLTILIHDFTSNGYAPWIKNYCQIFLNDNINLGSNIISVNWAAGAEPPYVQAVANARLVALEVSQFINQLKSKYNSPNQVHIIGHGLGAHVAGYVGKLNPLERITALDPSGVYFLHMPPHTRLHKDDANYVEVLHTDDLPSGQGYSDVLGHADFYANGGKNQPGCEDTPVKVTAIKRDHLKLGESMSTCSHTRSLKYYIEAQSHPSCSFIGFTCPTYKDFLKGKCSSCGERMEYCAKLGAPAKTLMNNSHGFHFVTANSGPFCTEVLKVLMVLKSAFIEQSFVKGYFNVSIPQSIGEVNFLLNENHAIAALGTDDHHVFMVFRSVPPPLMLPAEAVHVKWVQGPIPTAWSAPPKVSGLMIYKMTDEPDSKPQWFCSINEPLQTSLGLGLEPCILRPKHEKPPIPIVVFNEATTNEVLPFSTQVVDYSQLNYV